MMASQTYDSLVSQARALEEMSTTFSVKEQTKNLYARKKAKLAAAKQLQTLTGLGSNHPSSPYQNPLSLRKEISFNNTTTQGRSSPEGQKRFFSPSVGTSLPQLK